MSQSLKYLFLLLFVALELFGVTNRLLSTKINNNSLVLEFSNSPSPSDIKINSLDAKENAKYRQFFDIKAVLVTQAHSYKNSSISSEIKVSQFDKESVRVVALLEKNNKLTYNIVNKSVVISSEADTLFRQTQKKQMTEQKEDIFQLADLSLELEKQTQKSIKNEKTVTIEPNSVQIGSNRKKIVVLDPGHGGKDSGAIGIDSRYEKDVVFAISLLAKDLLQKRGYEVYLTRDGDYFVELQDRTRFANSKSADLFVSIHANAVDLKHSDPSKAKGVETFFLSPARSDKAKRVAEKENGANMDMMDPLSKGAFLNVLNREKIVSSNKFAIDVHKFVLANLRTKFKNTVDGGVREAPFWVLVGAQMPAVLLEIGYITNYEEADRFDNPMFRALLSKSIADGIDSYFGNN